jgi:hypothetical protein
MKNSLLYMHSFVHSPVVGEFEAASVLLYIMQHRRRPLPHTVLCFTQQKCMRRSLGLSIIKRWPQDAIRMAAGIKFFEVIAYACCEPRMPCLQFYVMLQ